MGLRIIPYHSYSFFNESQSEAYAKKVILTGLSIPLWRKVMKQHCILLVRYVQKIGFL